MQQPFEQPLSLLPCFIAAFRLVKTRFWRVFPFFLFGQLLLVSFATYYRLAMSCQIEPPSSSYLNKLFDLPAWVMWGKLACGLLMIFVFSFTLHQLGKQFFNTPYSFADSIKIITRKYVKLVLASILMLGVSFLGVMALVLPGIFFGVVFFIYYPFIILEDYAVFAAFRQSLTVMWGQWWRTFALLLVAILMSLVIGVIMGAIGLSIVRLLGTSLSSPHAWLVFEVISGVVQVVVGGLISYFGVGLQIIVWHNAKLRYQQYQALLETVIH